MSHADELSRILNAGDAEACIALLESLSETDRQKLGPQAKAALDEFNTSSEVADGANRRKRISNYTDQQRSAAVVAVIGTTPLKHIATLDWPLSRLDQDIFISVVRRLRVPWLGEWVSVLGRDTLWFWPLTRRLAREALIERPECDEYILGMLSTRFQPDHQKTVHDALLADQGLLEWEVWRLFEVEGAGELSLAAHDKYSHETRTWEAALRRLAEEGRLDRSRLLDASLEALSRDFAQFRVGWYSRFHDSLEPDIEERAARAIQYLRLLGSSIPPTVSFALSALTLLDAGGRLEPQDVVSHIGPALAARAKASVLMALRLLGSAAERRPELRSDVALLAASALSHESPEIQKAALEIIDTVGASDNQALRKTLASFASSVAPSLRKRLARWTATPIVAEVVEPRPAAASISRLDAARAITPIASLGELVDRFGFVLENEHEIEEVERVLDGVSRFASWNSPDLASRLRPLAKRAATLRSRGAIHDRPIQSELARTAISWATRRVEPSTVRTSFKSSVPTFFSCRVEALLERVASQVSRPLISTPTHQGGWIDARLFVGKLNEWQVAGDVPDIYDQVLGLLRLAPDARGEALQRAVDLEGELGSAVRHALGSSGEKVGKAAALWIAAARARDARGDDPRVESRHPGLGPDAGHAACYEWRVVARTSGEYTFRRVAVKVGPPLPRSVPESHLSVLLHQPEGIGGVHESVVRWACSLWPAQRDAVYSRAVQQISENLGWDEVAWQDRSYFEPLLDSHSVFSPMAILLLAIGLATKEPGQSGLATDVFIEGISDGRLDASELGTCMGKLFPTGLITIRRWVTTLGGASRLSPDHANAVCVVLQRTLRGGGKTPPRDVSLLLELLHELMIELEIGVTDADARSFLEGCAKKGGKASKLAKSLLALASTSGEK